MIKNWTGWLQKVVHSQEPPVNRIKNRK